MLDDPEPEVWLVGFGDSSVNFQLLIHFDCRKVTPFRLEGRIYFEIWDALHEAGIEIPFPQRDLHVRSADVMPQLQEMMGGRGGEDEIEQGPARIESLEDADKRERGERDRRRFGGRCGGRGERE